MSYYNKELTNRRKSDTIGETPVNLLIKHPIKGQITFTPRVVASIDNSNFETIEEKEESKAKKELNQLSRDDICTVVDNFE